MTKLVISDLSNIEGRVLAFLAGEEWKLQAFRDYDAGTGPDVYNLTAVGIIGGDPWAVAKADRNVFGKVPDLALGYEGGVGALQTFAKAYGVTMSDHWPTIKANVRSDLVTRAFENYDSWGKAKAAELEIDKKEWVASESVKLAWRDRHPATRRLWYDLKDAAIDAIQNPGRTFKAGPHLKVGVRKNHGQTWLLIRLPSGKYLTYFAPHKTADGGISYWGMGDEDGKGKRYWCKLYTYGGKMAENACQSLARDIIMHGIRLAEGEGYATVLTVHDEAVTEVPKLETYSVDGLSRCLATVPEWAEGLPLAAAGFEAYRYKKD